MKPAATPEKAAPKRRLLMAVAQRLGLFLVVGAALLVIYWSVNRLLETQRQGAALDQQFARLTGDIELMQTRWSEAKTADLQRRVADARQELFEGAPAVQAWEESIRAEAVPLALDAEIAFTGTRQETMGDQHLTLMQATIDLAPAEGVASERSSYRRVLDFSQRLAAQSRRLDLLELSVQGGSNSVGRARAVVELWATDPENPQP